MKKQKILLGAHISSAGGFHKAIERAEALGCTTMQIFTKNNKTWFGKAIPEEEISLFKESFKKSSLSKIMVHTAYLINIGSSKPEIEKQSISSLKHELHRCEELGIPYLVLHPGAHLGSGEEICIEKIAHNLDLVLASGEGSTSILLETTAGQGTSVGHTFEQIKKIISLCEHKKLIGVCLDTCHIFAAGYDIGTKYEEVMEQFEKAIGFKYLKAIHLNDSKSKLNSHVDRHESIGLGEIPIETFSLIMNDERLQDIPKILETPDPDLYAKEIEMLTKMVKKRSS